VPQTRNKFDPEFLKGAVCIVRDTGKPIAQAARDLGIDAGTLGNGSLRMSMDIGNCPLADIRTPPNAKVRKVLRTATWPG
jgi:transposase-like protein